MKKLMTLWVVLGMVFMSLPSHAMAAPMSAKIYKDPNCGCCAVYADYLAAREIEVEIVETDQVVEMSRMMGVPEDMQGCHLTMIDGYAVSGHVPFETIERLLEERPDFRAISLPGMPMGSPGMGGVKKHPFEIYQISDGGAEIYDVR